MILMKMKEDEEDKNEGRRKRKILEKGLEKEKQRNLFPNDFYLEIIKNSIS